jgi:predicted double-glycine peptidase
MIWLAVQLLGSAVLIAAGVAAFRRSHRLATGLVAAMLSMLLFKVAIARTPAGEARLFSWNWYPFVEGWWFLFPAMFIFGAGIMVVRRSVWKRDGLMVAAGLLLVHCGVLAILTSQPHQLTGRVDDRGICHQTSGYSCSAASAVMLLHQAGVPATEQEMAELCVTRPGGTIVSGTSDSGAMRGLRLKMAGRGRPVISTPAYDQLTAPAMVAIAISNQISHSIVVVKVEADQVKVIDPLYGRGTISRRQFERDWKGIAITLERSGS